MQKYEENLAANTSGALRPLAGASVTVTDQVTGLPATLYSDNGVTPLAQPLTTDNDGYVGFYAADGKYTLTFTGPRFAQFTRSIVLEDPDDNPYATLAQLNAGSGALLVRHGETLVGEVLDELSQGVDGLAEDVDGLTTKVGDLEQAIEDIGPGGGYTLPIASATVLGGIKLGANLTADAGGVVSAGVTNGAIVSALASAATAPRTYTFPDKNITVAGVADIAITKYVQTADQAIVSAGTLTIAHGLGVAPKLALPFIRCLTSEHDAITGQVLPYGPTTITGLEMFNCTVKIDETNIYVRFGNAANVFLASNGASHTNSKFVFFVRAYA